MGMKKYDLIFTDGPTFFDPNAGVVQTLGGTSILQIDASMLRNANQLYHPELQYLALLQELVDKADADPTPREDRTGTGTYSVFGRQMRFDLSLSAFPVLTTKKVWWKGVVAELLWMLSGDTNIKALTDQNVHIWDEWADENGNLGPVYGAQWRGWTGYEYHNAGTLPLKHSMDQITKVVEDLKNNPGSRRHIVIAWNPAEVPDMALPPCHMMFQFYVDDGKLSCQLYQRSADIFLGVPFNLSSYALLTALIAREVGLELGEFIHTFGDLHLYANHVEQAKEQLTRTPRSFPEVSISSDKTLFEHNTSDILLLNYDPHPAIEAEVSI